MIKRLSISGLGPHADFAADFNPRGITNVSGPSESGKSTLVEALCLVLWGRTTQGRFQPEAIREEAKKAIIELTLDSGRVLRRSITRTRSQQRSITQWGETTSYSSEKAYTDALGALGEDPEALRMVLVPLGWQELVVGNARKFRDVLARILPEQDVGEEVKALMLKEGFEATDTEIRLPEKQVMGLRSSTRKERDEANGRKQSAEERIAAIEAALADSPAFDIDTTLLDQASQWDAYDRVVQGAAARGQAEIAQKAWDQRLADLGPEPQPDPAHAQAAAAFQQAQVALQTSTQNYQGVFARHQSGQQYMQQFTAVGDPSTCPTCKRPGWEQGAAMFQQVQANMQQLQAELDQATAQYQQAQGVVQQAQVGMQAAQEHMAKIQAWKSAFGALGKRPVLPAIPDDAPEPPPFDRPDPETVQRMRSMQNTAMAAEGARRQQERDLETTRAILERETGRFEAADAKDKRLTALLNAVRAAPSIVAERQALALGDMGPVSLEFGDNPAVKVLIDKRPWWLASRGRQVVADMHLRDSLRRAMDKHFLPIFVDNAQDVGGQPLPELEGPVILMQTNDSGRISVRRQST